LPEWQKKSGSAEILIETNNRSWALQFFMLPPPLPGHPPITINPDEVEIYPKKRGGQRNAPPGNISLLGREGFIHQGAAENKQIETKGDFNRAKKC
jgi:hypothetical protein